MAITLVLHEASRTGAPAIGATTPNAGAFTTLTATTAIPVTSGGTGATTLTGYVYSNGYQRWGKPCLSMAG